ncbi:two-component system, OmpR family, sensor histidine kinase SenX3 [Quadrisphaera granulorum]|uniref:Sensor-like histidine kinase SenX3 n=1 Tax=Quadrisphaera granulorum TaxID=317664 RepID=A0A316A1D5_9ACTN|nr:two-component system sensor histidine kinase SenX3 [Quadrisphaera granulorum]SZE97693.1 two-component system, OmpR family, sensor histidine kinase SenX3 [Quadrisphaera granulorum]
MAAALLGLVVGCLVALAVRRDDVRVVQAPPPGTGDLPAGVPELLAVLGGPAVVLDVSDVVVRASPAAHAVGLVRRDSITDPDVLAAVRAVRADGEVREVDVDLRAADVGGARRALSVRVAPLGLLHVVVLGSDRTEARRLEAVRRDFVVNVGHELKTPVGAMSVLAEAMADAADDPEAVRRFSARMAVEARRLAVLVHDVVELSRLQDGEPLAAAVRVDVDTVVAEAVDRCSTTAGSRGIGLEIGPDTGAQVIGDAELLTTAIRNLVDNAIRYSDTGTRVAVGVRVDEAADVVEVSVTDQGIGIGPADRERIFERFYRVDPARSRMTGGTGLGLSIVKHVVAGHGGEVQLWSQEGQGSTFTLRVPQAPPRQPVRAGADAADSEQEEYSG